MKEELYIQKRVIIEHRKLFVDGQLLFKGALNNTASDFFNDLYRFLGINYLRFFKMDMLSKTLFLATEALLKGSALPSVGNPLVALTFFNSHSSIDTDKAFQASILSSAFFPSPSLFIYTLPNIALGEVAIRNRFMGENSTFITPKFDAKLCVDYVKPLIIKNIYTCILTGWFDFVDDKEEADIFIVSKEKTDKIFNINNLEKK